MVVSSLLTPDAGLVKEVAQRLLCADKPLCNPGENCADHVEAWP